MEQLTVQAQRIEPWQIEDSSVRALLAKIVRRVGKEKISKGMTELLGRPITVCMLNDFVRESKRAARFPICYVEAFCQVTRDDTLRRHLLGSQLREMLELGERAAAILNESARKKLLASGNGKRHRRERASVAPGPIRLKAAASSRRQQPNGRSGLAERVRA